MVISLAIPRVEFDIGDFIGLTKMQGGTLIFRRLTTT